MSVDDGAEPFVRDVVLEDGGSRPAPAAPKGTSWIAPSCRDGCRMRYRFLLGEAARALHNPEVAADYGGAFVAPPSTWLLRPVDSAAGTSFRFHVDTPEGTAFVTGVHPAAVPSTWQADVADLSAAPYSAFGALRTTLVDAGSSRVELSFAPGRLDREDAAFAAWVRTSAEVVASYFGAFPVPRVLVLIVPTDEDGFGYARALGNGGASILAPVGKHTTAEDFRTDWVMVHEMLHLGFPTLPRDYLWLAEGIATYVEPIARARAGTLHPDEVWAGLIRGLPNGLPGPGDRGLDVTHTWGRTYWGGALFCLVADLDIRERTQGRRSLDDALRGVLRAGGTIARRWQLADVLRLADDATGVPALSELHERLGRATGDVELAKIWKRLGVELAHGKIVYDDRAPLSSIRRAITSPDR
jgi:hypothetical protein